MRALIKILIVLGVAAAVVTLVGEGPGYVLIQVGDYTLETTAAFVGVVLALFLAFGWEIWGFLSATWHAPSRLREARKQRRRRRSLTFLEEGTLALERGQAERARKLLARGGRQAEAPAAFYVGAARAAHQAGEDAAAEEFLAKAQNDALSDDPAATLLRAEIEMDAGRAEHALALLSSLEEQEPENRQLLRRLLVLYRQVEDWEALMRLVPRARKAGILSEGDAAEELQEARARRLEQARLAGNGVTVERLWKEASREERADSRLMGPWIRYLLSEDRGQEAERALEQGLKRHWRGELVDLYLALPQAPGAAQELLQRLERWLSDHPRDPHLLTVLAQLAIAARLWGKADQYLEEASSQEDLPAEILLRLAHLYQEREKPDQALACCRRSLTALEGRIPVLPAPEPGMNGGNGKA
ncbi:heme biosynthesis HemY N-terminal domain-containing protein [Thiohalorhabdus methylotrophus]|uniref:Heme biosynthesis HemY N-terminal domain-containing protein n=1 Tax=Thiohalorhabdus methylotrophus TaxID=3242694 RepID=A0ABV4TV93_9GAMM